MAQGNIATIVERLNPFKTIKELKSYVQDTYRGYGVSGMIQEALAYHPNTREAQKPQRYEPATRRKYSSRQKVF